MGFDSGLYLEYLEYNERQTKTRIGIDPSNVRRQKPRLYATGTERCPVATYKAYADHPFLQYVYYISENNLVITPKNCNKKCMKCTYFKQFVFHNFRERRSFLPWSGHTHREPKRRGTLVPVSPYWQEQAQLTYVGHGGESTTPRATVREEADQHKCRKRLCQKLLQ